MAADGVHTTTAETADTDVVFAYYAKQIDSTLHPDLVEEKRWIRFMNAFAKTFGQDELIVVGSSEDGSKVNVPGDCGDIDILLLPKLVKLDQDFIDYSEQYPAFLHVRVEGPHLVYFKNIKLVDRNYLPVVSLKALRARFYDMVILFVNLKRQARNADELNYINHSAVGFENVTIDASDVDIEFPERESTSFKAAIELFCQHLNTFIDLAKSGNKQVRFEEEDESTIQSERNKIPNTLHRVIDFFTNNIDGEDEEKVEPTDALSTPDVEEETSSTTKAKLQEDIYIESVTQHQSNENDNLVTQTAASIQDHVIPMEVDHENTGRETGKEHGQEHHGSNNKPSNHGTTTENKCEDIKLNKLLSADYVPVFPMKGWPKIAYEWLSRNRHWPTQETIELVKKTGCHVVAKRPLLPEMKGDPKNEDHSPEHDAIDKFFRVSFSQCELVLSKSLSEPQLQCWRVLKAYQKAYLQTDPRVLASYHWKNIVFKVFEDTEPEFWTKISILKGVQKALDLMIECLEGKSVPLYFIPECNLIQGCREDLIEQVRDRVVQIRDNPLEHLKQFISNPPPPDQCNVEPEKLKQLVSNETVQSIHKKTFFGLTQMMRHRQFSRSNDNDGDSRVPDNFKNLINTTADIAREQDADGDLPHAPFFQGMNAIADSFIPSEDSPDAEPNLDMVLDTFRDMAKYVGDGDENHPITLAFNEFINLIKPSNNDDSPDNEIVSNILGSFVKVVESMASHKQKSGVKKTNTDANESTDTSKQSSSHTRSPAATVGVPEASNGHVNPNNNGASVLYSRIPDTRAGVRQTSNGLVNPNNQTKNSSKQEMDIELD